MRTGAIFSHLLTFFLAFGVGLASTFFFGAGKEKPLASSTTTQGPSVPSDKPTSVWLILHNNGSLDVLILDEARKQPGGTVEVEGEMGRFFVFEDKAVRVFLGCKKVSPGR